MPFTKASICGRVSRSFPPRYVNRHGTLGFSAVGIFATGHSSFLNPLWRQMFFGQRQYRRGNRRWGSADTLPRTDFRMPKHLPSEPYRLNSTIQNCLPLTVHRDYPRFFRTRRYTPRRRPKAIEAKAFSCSLCPFPDFFDSREKAEHQNVNNNDTSAGRHRVKVRDRNSCQKAPEG